MEYFQMIDCEIRIAMNEDGDWVVCTADDNALEQLANEVGGALARVVAITVRMSPPVMTEASVTVPDAADSVVTARHTVEAAE
jgi:hypothetical protein